MKIKATLVYLFLSLVLQKTVYSQFNQVWDASFAHTQDQFYSNEGRKVAVDPSGNIFTLNDVTSNIDIGGNVTTSTYHYSVLIKYDANGTFIKKYDIEVYDHHISGFNNLGAFGLKIDNLGNVYAGVSFYDPLTGFDIWVMKFDNNLTYEWTLKYNPVSVDSGVDMEIDDLGNIYVLGKSVSASGTEYVLLKSDYINFYLATVQTFDMNLDHLKDMAVDDSQNIFVTGYRLVNGFKTVLTAAVSGAGTLMWKSIYDGGSASRDDFGNSIVYGTDGYIYVTGSSDQGFPNTFDFLTIKYYAGSGKKIWITFHHHGVNDHGIFVANIDPAYVFVGSVSGSHVLLTRISTSNGVLSGNFVYQPVPGRPYTSISSVSLNAFEISTNNKFYITGNIIATDSSSQTFSAAYFTKLTLLNSSRIAFKVQEELSVPGEYAESYDAVGIAFNYTNDNVLWLRNKIFDYALHTREVVELLSLDMPSPIRISSFDNPEFKITFSPNPTSDFVLLKSAMELREFEVLNVSGQILYGGNLNGNTTAQLDLSKYESGIYLLRVYSSEGNVTNHKIIKL